MIEIVADKFKLTFDDAGKLATLHIAKDFGWASIPTTDLSHPLAQEWKQWEASNSPLNLSDRPPTPAPVPPDFATFARTIRSNNFWKNKIRKTLQKEAFVELCDEMSAIAIVGPSTERLQSLVSLWNEVVGSLTVGVAIAPADVTFLNATATSNRVPLTFATNGTASVTS